MTQAEQENSVVCPSCHERYDRIGVHWARSSCEYPSLSEKQRELWTGLLMSDAWVNAPNGSNEHAMGICVMINKRFLEWADKELGWLTTGVKHYRSAAECAKLSDGHEDDYRDQYKLATRTLPVMDEFRNWYDSGSKRFPQSLELTPTMCKAWYAGDGHIHWARRQEGTESSGVVHFGVSNEDDRKEYILSLFREKGFEVTWDAEKVRLSTEDSERLLDWMGDAPPGFEYKWANDSHAQYKKLKND